MRRRETWVVHLLVCLRNKFVALPKETQKKIMECGNEELLEDFKAQSRQPRPRAQGE